MGDEVELKFLLITLPGLEKAIEIELSRFGFNGEVISRARAVGELNEPEKLRTIESYAEILAEDTVRDESRRGIRLLIRRILIENPEVRDAIENARTVTIKGSVYCRLKCLDYRMLELIAAREITRVFRGISVKPKMGDLVLRVEILNNKLIIAKELKSRLHERGYTRFKHPAMINPLAASSMSLLANISSRDVILDPFCGAGTIPIEANLTCGCEAHGSDLNREYIKGAVINSKEANVRSGTCFFISSIKDLSVRNAYNALITDPPRGIRLKVDSLKAIYRYLIEAAGKALLDKGKLIVSTLNRNAKLLIRIAEMTGKFNLTSKVDYVQGGYFCSIIILEFTS